MGTFGLVGIICENPPNYRDRDLALLWSRINERAISHCDCRCQSEAATRYPMARRPRSEHELFNAPVQHGTESEKVSKQIDEELRVRLISVLSPLRAV